MFFPGLNFCQHTAILASFFMVVTLEGCESMKQYRAEKKILLILILSFLSPVLCWAWQVKVVGISDGDTIKVLYNGKQEKIRLYGIDCPEGFQDFGKKAKKFTSAAVFGKTVSVKPIDTDRYGRTVGIVIYAGGTMNLNAELIRAGYAWVYLQYCKRPECKMWEFIEVTARDEKNGLWSMPNPVPLWEFRRNGNSSRASTVVAEPKERHQASVVYHGNVSSHAYHAPGCRHYDCKNCTDVFQSKEEAEKAGYRAHRECLIQGATN